MELLDRRDGKPFDLADVEVATRMAAAVTAVARASTVEREAQDLLRAVLTCDRGHEASAITLDHDAIEALVDEIAIERLSRRRSSSGALQIGSASCAPPTRTTSSWRSLGWTRSWRERNDVRRSGRRRLV